MLLVSPPVCSLLNYTARRSGWRWKKFFNESFHFLTLQNPRILTFLHFFINDTSRMFYIFLYLNSAQAGTAMFSHNTAETSCSCWILSFQSPRVPWDSKQRPAPLGSQPPVTLLLRTPSMQWDHTALLNKAGPWNHRRNNGHKNQPVCWWVQVGILTDVTKFAASESCLESGWFSGLRASHRSQRSGCEVTLQVQRAVRVSDSSPHHTKDSSSTSWNKEQKVGMVCFQTDRLTNLWIKSN